MSALEEYRKLKRIFSKDNNYSEQKIFNSADAAIAELEADLDVLDAKYVTVQHELAALKGRRCRTCKSWDDEDVEEVAAVRFSWCRNGMATKEFKSVVVSEGWLCPLWAAREETP